MKKLLSVLVLLGLYGTAVGFQQIPIPDYPGDDNPQHSGQPLFCQNYETREHAHNCECLEMDSEDSRCKLHPEDEDWDTRGPMSTKCKTRCRRDACLCQRKCDT